MDWANSVKVASASAKSCPTGTRSVNRTRAPSVRLRVSESQNKYHLTRYSLVITRPRCWNQ